MNRKMCLGFISSLLLLAPTLFGAEVEVDSQFPDYKPVQEGVQGSLKSIGSDTMNNLMSLWAEGFKRFYPSVKLEIEGKGSSSGPPALVSGSAQFAPMSRPMKEKEIDEFEKKFGYKPTGEATSIDTLAVFIHKDNPTKGLTFPQVDAIFSKTRKGKFPKEIRNWGDLGLSGDWSRRPISLYGRNSASGTYGFFKEHVLYNGDFKDQVKEQPGTAAVVSSVAGDKYSIGYGGIGYKTPNVRALPLARDEGEDLKEPIAENAYSGEYPLSRPLLIYINHKPGSQLEPKQREFFKYVFSKQGQQEVVKDGYLPVTVEMAREQLQQIGIKPTF